MLKTFIERPVLSTVVSIVIVILGILAITTLPVTQYPDIAPPTVQVSANYPGANAATVLESVIITIEQQINGVYGMAYLTCNASNNGSARIQLFFKPGVTHDTASVNQHHHARRATALLPTFLYTSGVPTS